MTHGTMYAWRKGCRCEPCVMEHRTNNNRQRAARRKRGLPDDDKRHGTANGYNGYGCRCTPCRDAQIVLQRNRRWGSRLNEGKWQVKVNPATGRMSMQRHGTHHLWTKGCRCDLCLVAHDQHLKRVRDGNRIRMKAWREARRAEMFVPADMFTLVSDILETYHWEAWTARRLMMEVARIRRVKPSESLLGMVRKARTDLAQTDDVVAGEVLVTGYENGGPITRSVQTIRWRETA